MWRESVRLRREARRRRGRRPGFELALRRLVGDSHAIGEEAQVQAVDDDRALGMKVMKLSRMLRLRFDRRVQPLGLTRAQWQTIACVRRMPGATQREVAGLLEVGEVTVGRSIDKLVEAGWVERRADPADRRAHRLFLTATVEPLIGELTRIGEEEEAAALAGFDAGERAALHAMLARITANLGDDADPAAATCAASGRPG